MTQSLPHYRHSLRMLLPFLRALTGAPSSLSRDCALMLRDAHPAPRALNTHHIPSASSFILVINHYDRRGLGAWWSGALVAATIARHRTDPREIRPVMAREWWYPKGWQRLVKQPFSRWAFGRIAKAYGIVTLPPVNEEYKGTGGADVWRVLALTRGDPPELVGMAPEGFTGAGRALCEPPNGGGLFLILLSRNKIPFLPVGIFEDDEDRLTANFGAPFTLSVPASLPREERDREAARQVMVQIGRLLPEWMWGAYREEILKVVKT